MAFFCLVCYLLLILLLVSVAFIWGLPKGATKWCWLGWSFGLGLGCPVFLFKDYDGLWCVVMKRRRRLAFLCEIRRVIARVSAVCLSRYEELCVKMRNREYHFP
ncbi:hypothetical protein QBC37DRAFT_432456 [Rhypophila decipiens]|uniref:Transmembrane protein n=1 Tax=Rhypophila decipiens TaxID=261697 RepID=A0AAN6XWQ1_9PEZI|nr:hypothetical protein QBC37DRAFT_432456 [Rhypophila decipiens]